MCFYTCYGDFRIVSIQRGLNGSGYLMLTIDLTGKTAVVTGASQGLGEATARMLQHNAVVAERSRPIAK